MEPLELLTASETSEKNMSQSHANFPTLSGPGLPSTVFNMSGTGPLIPNLLGETLVPPITPQHVNMYHHPLLDFDFDFTSSESSPTGSESLSFSLSSPIENFPLLSPYLNTSPSFKVPSSTSHAHAHAHPYVPDTSYRVRREKNNESAKRCRQKKREVEEKTALENERLVHENTMLRARLQALEEQLDSLKTLISTRLDV